MKKLYNTLLLTIAITLTTHSQITLSGTSYSENFDNVATGLPTGFAVYTGATASALGTAQTFLTTATSWNTATGQYRNSASFDGLISSSSAAAQAASADRVIGLRQSAGFGDIGAAFAMQLANTTGFSNFSLSFNIQSLDIASPRVTTWVVDYGIGTSPSSFTAMATTPATITTGGSTFTNSNVTVSFGSALDNINQPVWIRIVTLTATTGSGTRPTTGIDDLVLNYTNGIGCTTPSQASSATITNITSNGFDIGWTAGSGTNSLVVVKSGSAVAGAPVNGLTYTANSTFGSGQTIAAGEYVIYNSTGNTVSVSGLMPGTVYHVAVFSFDNTGPCYNTASPATNNTTTACGEPSLQVSTINVNASLVSASLNWSGGNGSGVLVKINTVNSFTAPVDGTTYTGNNTYGGGEQVLYYGNANSTFVDGLSAATAYYVTVYAYNLCGGLPDYRTAGNIVRTFSTLANNGIPLNYYSTTTGLSCAALKTELRNIISTGLTQQSYNDLWTIYQTADVQPAELSGGNVIWDIYSDDPTGMDPYEFAPVTDQCGTYAGEGDCYNREHSFPQSWFGGGTGAGPGTDYHHIFPTDGYVNGQRSNFPYGRVGSVTYLSDNGSKLGTSTWPGITGTVFEPINEYKGDVARAFLYMVTCYQNNMASWESLDVSGDVAMDGTSWPSVEIPYLQLMLQWHNSDPVSQKEVDRNNAAIGFQGNRNPFVDHPEYVDQVWSTSCGLTLPVDITDFRAQLTGNTVLLKWKIERPEGFSHFEIERSIYGGVFEKTGEVQWIAGRNNYSFNDDVATMTGEVLYRLKMVDRDNNYKYSKILAVTLPGFEKIALIYPNPANHILTVSFREPVATHVTFHIFDMSGRSVSIVSMQRGQLSYPVNISKLLSGMYLLKCVKDGKVSYAKFLVER